MLALFQKWAIFLLVALFGCIGAALAYGLKATGPVELVEAWNNPVAQTILQVGIGAFASTVFIFLLSNTDRNDLFRLVCLSMVAGFLWNPVIETIKKYNLVAEQSKAKGQQVASTAAAASETLKEEPSVATTAVNDFLKEYATTRPLLLTEDAKQADQALNDIILQAPPATWSAIPDTTLGDLKGLQDVIPKSSPLWDVPALNFQTGSPP